jgi:hypothetical protein
MRKTTLPATVDWLYAAQREWDQDPPYQRPGGQWRLAQKQRFIDSLLNNFAVPPIYLHRLPKGSAHRCSVIDGKQRLETIREFIDGRFALAPDFALLERSDRTDSAPRPGERYGDFTETWRSELLGQVIGVEEIEFAADENAEALVREIFLRLNSGTPMRREQLERVRRQLGEAEAA